MRSKGIVFVDKDVVEYSDVESVDPGPNDVVLDVLYSWISTGTEQSYLQGERIAGEVPRVEGDPHPFPVVPGYLRAGIVDWVGSEVTHVKLGDVVFASWGRVCGTFDGRGGHVSPSTVSEEDLVKLGIDCCARAYAPLALTQVGFNCGMRPPVEIGWQTVVVGDGLVGQWTAQTLAWRGAEVTLVGRHAERLACFGGSGHENRRALHVGDATARARIEDAMPEGIDLVVDTVGTIRTIAELIPMMRADAHIVSIGFYGENDLMGLLPLRRCEATIHCLSGMTAKRMEATRKLIGYGVLDTLGLVTHTVPVSRAVEMWDVIQTRSAPFLGVVFEWESM